jgi:integrase
LLDAHKRRDGRGPWIFAGPKKGFSLSLDNLSRREIKPTIGDRWRGWHAFRRGLGTILCGLGVPAETAKVILRHSAVAVTQKHYIKLKSANEGRAAMNKLEKAIAKSGPQEVAGLHETRANPHGYKRFLEPTSGLEPLTCRLRIGCSTN